MLSVIKLVLSKLKVWQQSLVEPEPTQCCLQRLWRSLQRRIQKWREIFGCENKNWDSSSAAKFTRRSICWQDSWENLSDNGKPGKTRQTGKRCRSPYRKKEIQSHVIVIWRWITSCRNVCTCNALERVCQSAAAGRWTEIVSSCTSSENNDTTHMKEEDHKPPFTDIIMENDSDQIFLTILLLYYTF